jgi:hypothetical protein
MTLKTFLNNNILTAVEIFDGYELIGNICIEDTIYGLRVDTSNIVAGTPLIHYTDFTLENDTLTVAGISINTNDVTMLGM